VLQYGSELPIKGARGKKYKIYDAVIKIIHPDQNLVTEAKIIIS
jgi:hypothetical protein